MGVSMKSAHSITGACGYGVFRNDVVKCIS